MLRVITILSILSMASSSEPTKTTSSSSHSSSCTPYPSDFESLEECCNVPILFEDNLIGNCEFICSEDKKDDKDCIIKCLLVNNRLMRKGVMNETAVLYTYHLFGLGNPGWLNITADSYRKCSALLNDSKSLTESFEKYEKCMNENMQKHCIEGKEPVECDEVEEFMLKCQNIHADCDTWPRWIVKLPEYCCPNRPELFTSDMRSSTESFCSDSDMSNLGRMQCAATRMLNLTEIKTAGKWNFPNAQKLLTEHSKNNKKWKKAIEKTIETCQKQVHDDEQAKLSDALVDFWFYECIKASLADFCPEYLTTKKECRRIKRYKDACPNSIPPRRLYMVNGKM